MFSLSASLPLHLPIHMSIRSSNHPIVAFMIAVWSALSFPFELWLRRVYICCPRVCAHLTSFVTFINRIYLVRSQLPRIQAAKGPKAIRASSNAKNMLRSNCPTLCSEVFNDFDINHRSTSLFSSTGVRFGSADNFNIVFGVERRNVRWSS